MIRVRYGTPLSESICSFHSIPSQQLASTAVAYVCIRRMLELQRTLQQHLKLFKFLREMS
jgi:hypothetical protein